MEQNKIRTYFLYAVGEIALVMIGILLALQVNNWNQQRINLQKESRYIDELIRDLNIQLEEIENVKNREFASLEKLNRLLDMYQEKEQFTADETTASLFISVIERTSYTIKDPTYTELIATGNIELIRDEQIRNQIIQYYQRMEKSELIIQKNNDLNDQSIKPKAIEVIEIWPPGFADIPNGEGMVAQYGRSDFPAMRKSFVSVLSDPQKTFALNNLIKMKLLISASAVEDLLVSDSLTVSLKKKLEAYP